MAPPVRPCTRPAAAKNPTAAVKIPAEPGKIPVGVGAFTKTYKFPVPVLHFPSPGCLGLLGISIGTYLPVSVDCPDLPAVNALAAGRSLHLPWILLVAEVRALWSSCSLPWGSPWLHYLGADLGVTLGFVVVAVVAFAVRSGFRFPFGLFPPIPRWSFLRPFVGREPEYPSSRCSLPDAVVTRAGAVRLVRLVQGSPGPRFLWVGVPLGRGSSSVVGSLV